MPQYFSFNPTQPNSSHVLENATQPNPTQPNTWMDPTHVHLCDAREAARRAGPSATAEPCLTRKVAVIILCRRSVGRFHGLLTMTNRSRFRFSTTANTSATGRCCQPIHSLPLLTLLRFNNSTNCYDKFQRPHRC